MKYCSKCGAELEDDVAYCPQCGNSVENSIKTSATTTNGYAIAGFICSFFIPLLGWIFGGIGLKKAKENGGTGKGLAVAAIIIASAIFLYSLVEIGGAIALMIEAFKEFGLEGLEGLEGVEFNL